jgi:hypothetical protein
MADFTLNSTMVPDGSLVVYEGPFGPVEIHQSGTPDASFSLSGPNVPDSMLELGKYTWLPRRVHKSRNGKPFIAQVGNADVMIRNERPFCFPAIGIYPKLGAETLDRRYTLGLKNFGAWKVKRSDGSELATLRNRLPLVAKTGGQAAALSIDDRCDALDVAIILLLRSIGAVYDRLVTQATRGVAWTSG